MAGFRDLRAWQRSMDLALMVYRLTKSWPADEKFGLTNQARRSATSIPSNLAEGQGRGGNNEFRHFTQVAHGSLCELRTQIELGHLVGYVSRDQFAEFEVLAIEVGNILGGLIRHLSTNEGPSSSVS